MLILLIYAVLAGCQDEPVTKQLHAFYYPWYGTPELDGEYVHWRHDVLAPGLTKTYPGGDDIGANFYPEDGCYSSGDPEALSRQMKQLRQAQVGVICVSWLGPESFEAKVLPAIMDAAAEHGIKVNFHLEPAVQKSIHTIAGAIVDLTDQYGDHPAFYRSPETDQRGMFYVYDSYLTPSSEWARLLTPDGDISIRETPYDADVIGLILNENDTEFIEASGMDGGYAYFIVDGFSYGSTTANWPGLVTWAREKDLMFIPSVGPGYSDLRIRPWNEPNQREREEGQYFGCMFSKAIEADPDIIAITSFNEWHEGTQIEPAMPFAVDGFKYKDYQPLKPDGYLNLTARWMNNWTDFRAGVWASDSTTEKICGGGFSRVAVTHLAVGKNLQLATQFSDKYPAGGANALLDGVTGSTSYRDGCWQGYEGVDVLAEVDLQKATTLGEMRIGFLSDPQVWIFLPREIIIEGSRDGLSYQALGKTSPKLPEHVSGAFRVEQKIVFKKQDIRFIRITAKSARTCPVGHPGEGQPAWLFIDEIMAISPDGGSNGH